MPATDGNGPDAPEPHLHGDQVRSIITAGWFAFGCWALFLFRQSGRVVRVGEQQFAGIWDQRIEVLSFIVLPPNALILVPAAVAATVATHLAGPTQSAGLAVQLRIVRWAATFQIGIAALSVLSILINETGSPTEAQDIAMRLAGASMSAGIIALTRAAERSSPGWMPSR